MPLYRRLPKRGFTSLKSGETVSLRLEDLSEIKESIINIEVLKKNNLVSSKVKNVRIYKSSNIETLSNVTFQDIHLTKGVRELLSNT